MASSRKRATAAVAATLAITGLSITSGMPSALAANGCQDVTVLSSGYGQTTAEYASGWTMDTGGPTFWWNLRHTDGSIQAHGQSSPTGYASVIAPANIYYMQINATPGVKVHVCYNG